MNYEVGVHCGFAVRALRRDPIAVLRFLDRGHLHFGSNVDPQFIELCHEPSDEIGIELLQHPLAVLEDRDLCAGASGNVRKFRGDVTPADQHNPLR